MFYQLLSVFLGVAFAGNSGAISIPDPKTGEWCLFGIEHLGPKILHVNQVGTYQIRLENRSQCSFRSLELLDRLPKRTRAHGASPAPSSWREQYPLGPVLIWTDLAFRPGDTRDFHVSLSAPEKPGRELRNRFCLSNSRYAEEEYCHYFKIQLR